MLHNFSSSYVRFAFVFVVIVKWRLLYLFSYSSVTVKKMLLV